MKLKPLSRRTKNYNLTAQQRVCVALVSIACLTAGGCQDRVRAPDAAASIVVLNAPASGTVRRVLVGEGVSVREGALVVEIETDAARSATPNGAGDAERAASAQAAAARAATGTLQREVESASVEVQRVESLVAEQRAPPAQLDAARAVYQQAQERLQKGKDAATTAPVTTRDNPDAAKASGRQSTANTMFVRATKAGNVRVVAVRVGQRVSAGQPVVTLSSGS